MRREQAAFICQHVFDDERPVLLVCHTDRGDWQFLCGALHAGEGPRVVGINHLFERDEALATLKDLPNGWCGERSHQGADFVREPIASKFRKS
jgi:hypothetical protein